MLFAKTNKLTVPVQTQNVECVIDLCLAMLAVSKVPVSAANKNVTD